jgi:hypothetical protein
MMNRQCGFCRFGFIEKPLEAAFDKRKSRNKVGIMKKLVPPAATQSYC